MAQNINLHRKNPLNAIRVNNQRAFHPYIILKLKDDITRILPTFEFRYKTIHSSQKHSKQIVNFVYYKTWVYTPEK